MYNRILVLPSLCTSDVYLSPPNVPRTACGCLFLHKHLTYIRLHPVHMRHISFLVIIFHFIILLYAIPVLVQYSLCVTAFVLYFPMSGCTEAALDNLLIEFTTMQEKGELVHGSHILLPCRMWALDNNAGGIRDNWPWKTNNLYYHSIRYSG